MMKLLTGLLKYMNRVVDLLLGRSRIDTEKSLVNRCIDVVDSGVWYFGTEEQNVGKITWDVLGDKKCLSVHIDVTPGDLVRYEKDILTSYTQYIMCMRAGGIECFTTTTPSPTPALLVRVLNLGGFTKRPPFNLYTKDITVCI